MDAILIIRLAIRNVTRVKIADICKKLRISGKLHQIDAFPAKVTDASGKKGGCVMDCSIICFFAFMLIVRILILQENQILGIIQCLIKIG